MTPITSARIFSSAKQKQFLEKARNDLALSQSILKGLIDLSGSEWSLDQDEGMIEFADPNGTIGRAPVQIIGTFNGDDQTWLWADENPSIEDSLTAHARAMRTGVIENISFPDLLPRKLQTDLETCWDIAALTSLAHKSQGVYCGVMDNTSIFMTFGELSLSSAKTAPDEPVVSIPQSAPTTSSTPLEVVKSLMQAMHDWELFCETFQADIKAGKLSVREAVSIKMEAYEKLFKAHCSEKSSRRSSCFEIPPEYCREILEVIEDVRTGKNEHRVMISQDGHFLKKIRFDLALENDQWKITQRWIYYNENDFEKSSI